MNTGQMIFTAAAFMLPVILTEEKTGTVRCETESKRCFVPAPWENMAAALISGAAGVFFLLIFRSVGKLSDSRRQAEYLFVFCWLYAAAFFDLKSRRIPNAWILYGMCAWAAFTVFSAFAAQRGFGGILFSLCGALCGGGILLIGAVLRNGGIGMGDVKMYLVIGLFLGWHSALRVMLISLAAAGAWGLFRMAQRKIKPGSRLPIGPFTYFGFIAASVLWEIV